MSHEKFSSSENGRDTFSSLPSEFPTTSPFAISTPFVHQHLLFSDFAVHPHFFFWLCSMLICVSLRVYSCILSLLTLCCVWLPSSESIGKWVFVPFSSFAFFFIRCVCVQEFCLFCVMCFSSAIPVSFFLVGFGYFTKNVGFLL